MNVQQMVGWIEEGSLNQLESAWMQAIEGRRPIDTIECERVLKALVAAGQAETADTLGWALLTERVETLPRRQANELLFAVASGVPDGKECRSSATEYFQEHYADHPHFPVIMEAAGLQGSQSA